MVNFLALASHTKTDVRSAQSCHPFFARKDSSHGLERADASQQSFSSRRTRAMKRGRLILLILVVVFGLLAAAAVSILHDGLSAKAQPDALETAIARTPRKMAAPSSPRNRKKPIAHHPGADAQTPPP